MKKDYFKITENSENFPRRYIKSSKVRRDSTIPMSPALKDHPESSSFNCSSHPNHPPEDHQQLPESSLGRAMETRPKVKRHMSAPAGPPMLQRFSSVPIPQDVEIDLNGSFEGVSETRLNILDDQVPSKSMERTSEWKILPKLIMPNRPILHRFISAPVGIQSFGDDEDFLWDYNSVAV